MSRLRFVPQVVLVSLALILAGCSRSQPDYGLNIPTTSSNPGAGGYGDGQDGGPVMPGSAREFSVRVGDTVTFETDSSQLTPNAQQTLTAQAQWLQQYSNYPIMLEGHADERGTREYNIALGAQRAAAVKQFLTSRGVHPTRIRTISYGKERPVAVCSDISCWSQNRRAVTVLNGNGPVASN
jgi:peptidoglycan-associated lipoprotein